MSLLANIEHADMQVGETRNGKCPSCGKHKFYVTRKLSGYVYICFRASCGYKGFKACGFDPEDGPVKPFRRGTRGNSYYGETYLVDWTDMDWFQERFGVVLGDSPSGAAYWAKVTEDNRYYFPIWGPHDEYRGAVVRRPIWDGEPKPVREDRVDYGCPKAISHFEDDVAVRLAWYHSTDESTVVIVEDQVSAMRIASCGVTSVAILGTGFYPEFTRDFNRWHRGEFEAILALDPDAATKSLEIARKWGPTFKQPLRVAMLKRDAKDYSSDKQLWEDLGL